MNGVSTGTGRVEEEEEEGEELKERKSEE